MGRYFLSKAYTNTVYSSTARLYFIDVTTGIQPRATVQNRTVRYRYEYRTYMSFSFRLRALHMWMRACGVASGIVVR